MALRSSCQQPDLFIPPPHEHTVFLRVAEANPDPPAVHNLTDICWTKCVTGSIRNGKLDKGEESCAKNCVDRFLDANFLVIKQLENMRSSQ